MKTIFCDVDNTLVFAHSEFPQYADKLNGVTIGDRLFYINGPMVEKLKDFSARGHRVIIWSAGGEKWAQAVVDALDIDNDIFRCLSKPDWIFDDLQPSSWMPEAEFIDPIKGQVTMKERIEAAFRMGVAAGGGDFPSGTSVSKLIEDLCK